MSVRLLGKTLQSKCEMCSVDIIRAIAYLFSSDIKWLTNTADMTVCSKCARREIGTKNTKGWREINGKM